MTTQENLDHSKRRLEEIVSFFGVNAQTDVRETEDGYVLDLASSPVTPRLIGHHGETLRAIEYLVNQMAKQGDDDAPRVVVDVAGYRQARRHSLEKTAIEAAARVVASGEPEELEPMNPAERRIVHMALRDNEAVATESRGEGKSRRTVIVPKA